MRLHIKLVLPLFVKSYNKIALEAIGEGITDEEQTFLDKLYLEEQNPELKRLYAQNFVLNKFSKKLLGEAIKTALAGRFKLVFYSDLWFDIYLNDGWVVKTFVQIEDGGCSYYYSHLIYWIDNTQNIKIRVGPPTINLSTWLGLYPTGWCFCRKEDVQASANTIAYLCKYFIDICNELLDGLAPTHR